MAEGFLKKPEPKPNSEATRQAKGKMPGLHGPGSDPHHKNQNQ